MYVQTWLVRTRRRTACSNSRPTLVRSTSIPDAHWPACSNPACVRVCMSAADLFWRMREHFGISEASAVDLPAPAWSHVLTSPRSFVVRCPFVSRSETSTVRWRRANSTTTCPTPSRAPSSSSPKTCITWYVPCRGLSCFNPTIVIVLLAYGSCVVVAGCVLVQIKSVSYDENIVLRKLLADYCKVSVAVGPFRARSVD